MDWDLHPWADTNLPLLQWDEMEELDGVDVMEEVDEVDAWSVVEDRLEEQDWPELAAIPEEDESDEDYEEEEEMGGAHLDTLPQIARIYNAPVTQTDDTKSEMEEDWDMGDVTGLMSAETTWEIQDHTTGVTTVHTGTMAQFLDAEAAKALEKTPEVLSREPIRPNMQPEEEIEVTHLRTPEQEAIIVYVAQSLGKW